MTSILLAGAGSTISSGATPLLLDTYSGAAAAYSLRKLRNGYTGSAIRVRENGTSSEADIGFDGSGNLDTTALASHCGANSGFVVTWYDQSGNAKNATQATAASQPAIVSSGSLIVNALGSPSVLSFRDAFGFPGSSSLSASVSLTDTKTVILVGQGTNFHNWITGDNLLFTSATSTQESWSVGGFVISRSITQSVSQVYIRAAIINGASSSIRRNGAELNSGTFGVPISWGQTAVFGGPLKYIYYSELIFTKNTDCLNMEAAINDYYGVYA